MSNQPVTLSHAIEKFLSYPDIKSLSPSAQKSKERTLRIFQQVVGGAGFLVEFLTYDHFADTMEDLRVGGSKQENVMRKREGLQPRSGRGPLALKIDRTNLTQFADFLCYNSWVSPTFRPLKKFTHSHKAPSTEAQPPRLSVPRKDFYRLLDAAERHHPRSRIIVAIGLFYGRRVSEAKLVQWKHVDLEKSTMSYLNVKRGLWVADKPFMVNLKIELERWQEWMIKNYGPIDPDWYVIPAKWKATRLWQYPDKGYAAQEDPSTWPLEPNKPAGAESITEEIQLALEAIGFPNLKGEGLHTLRRTHMREFDRAGRIDLAQASADHKLRATTEHYTGNLAAKEAMHTELVGRDPWGLLETPEEVVPPKSEYKVIDLFTRRQVG